MLASAPLRLLWLLTLSATPPPPEVEVVPRAEWDPGYHEPSGVTRYPAKLEAVLTHIVIHHSDFDPPEGPANIRDYHRDVSGFADVGYHFIVAEDGTVYEGRPLQLLGAHAGQSLEANRAVVRARKTGGSVDEARKLDPDYGAIGIVLDGFFMYAPPPKPQLDATLRLVASLRERFDIEADGVITHREVRERRVLARDLTFTGAETVCPGDGLQGAVETEMRAPLRTPTRSSARQRGPAREHASPATPPETR